MSDSQRFAIVIATKDRPHRLARLLESLAQQSCVPEEIVIVDGGTQPMRLDVERFMRLPIDLVKVQPPSLTRQKNVGVSLLGSDASLVMFFDDDIVLEEGALEAMRVFWETAGCELGGAGFMIPSQHYGQGQWVKRLFALDGSQDGQVLRSGCNTPLNVQEHPYPTQWLRGGATVWRREVVERFPFNEWFVDNGYMEDVEYSLRVGQHYSLMAVPEARVRHEEEPLTWRSQWLFGIRQVTNRFYLVRRFPELSILVCLWSFVGQILLNMTVGLLHWGAGGVCRTLGNLVGLVSLVTVQPIQGWVRPAWDSKPGTHAEAIRQINTATVK